MPSGCRISSRPEFASATCTIPRTARTRRDLGDHARRSCAITQIQSRRVNLGSDAGCRPVSDRGLLSGLEQHQPIRYPVAGEGGPQRIGVLGEVGPPFVVHGHDRPDTEDLGGIGRVVAGQGQIGAVEFPGQLNRAGKQDREIPPYSSSAVAPPTSRTISVDMASPRSSG
jgi:hypothetical protein